MRPVASSPSRHARDRRSIRLLWRTVLAGLLCLLAGVPVTAQDGGRYLGVATCAGSTCHGRAEGNGAVVRQDEIATWQETSSPERRAQPRAGGARCAARPGDRRDAGARRGAVRARVPRLPRDERRRGRARATFQSPTASAARSCHGAAGGWIASHYTIGGTPCGQCRRRADRRSTIRGCAPACASTAISAAPAPASSSRTG